MSRTFITCDDGTQKLILLFGEHHTVRFEWHPRTLTQRQRQRQRHTTLSSDPYRVVLPSYRDLCEQFQQTHRYGWQEQMATYVAQECRKDTMWQLWEILDWRDLAHLRLCVIECLQNLACAANMLLDLNEIDTMDTIHPLPWHKTEFACARGCCSYRWQKVAQMVRRANLQVTFTERHSGVTVLVLHRERASCHAGDRYHLTHVQNDPILATRFFLSEAFILPELIDCIEAFLGRGPELNVLSCKCVEWVDVVSRRSKKNKSLFLTKLN